VNCRSIVASAIFVFALLSGATRAHHSFPGIYDTSQQRVLEGSTSEFLFRNPHAFIVLDITASNGDVEQWHLEMPPRWALERRGLTDSSIKTGDRLLVVCNPARDGGRSCGLGQRGGFYRSADDFLYGLDPRTLD